MTQKIGIDVHANTTGAESGARKLESAAGGAADSVADIAAAADKAGASIDKLIAKADGLEASAKRASDAAIKQGQYTVQRLTELQKQLGNVLGQPISMGDARTAALNFETSRARGKFRGRTVQDADDYLDYLRTSGLAAQSSAHRRAYRNEVVYSSMKGTDAARDGGLNPPSPPAPGGDGGSGGGGGIVQRAQSNAMSFGKGLLALAGITSIMGMAGQAVDMANEESIGLDTLKRRAGDLGVGFSRLQDEVRGATAGMGMTYVESARLAQQYAKVAGTFANANGERTGIGFSRAYGLDPSAGVDFMATMRRLRVTGDDDKSQQRLALMIGEAVSKGGYSGKADELLSAVTNFATDIARQTLSTPNVADIAGYITTLTKTGYAGLDPQGAASILATADQATRRGGGVGDASKNFQYAALANASPGMSIIQAGALWQAGLFGTTANTFSRGTPFGDFEHGIGAKTPALNNVPNLVKYMDQMQRMYPKSAKSQEFMVDAIQNQFGLSSYAQAAAFYQMAKSGPTQLGESQRLLSSAGLDPSKMNAIGIYGVGKVAAANDAGSLRSIYGQVMGRKDLKISDSDRSDLAKTMGGTDVEAMKQALVRVIATNGQEATPGSETRETITELKNELTRVGGVLSGVLNPIRSAVEIMAQHMAPEEWRQHQQDQKDRGKQFGAEANSTHMFGQFRSPLDAMVNRYALDDTQYHTSGGGYGSANRIAPKPSYLESGDSASYAVAMARYKHLHSVAAAESVGISSEQSATILAAAGGDQEKAAFLMALLRTENRGKPSATDAKSPKGAQGFWQFLPSTFAENGGGNIHDFGDGARAASSYVGKLAKRYNGNKAAMAAGYDGGFRQGDLVSGGSAPAAAETQEYLEIMHGLGALGNTRLPSDSPKSPGDATHKITLAGEVHLPVKDASGNVHGTAKLKPFVSSPAAGSGLEWMQAAP